MSITFRCLTTYRDLGVGLLVLAFILAGCGGKSGSSTSSTGTSNGSNGGSGSIPCADYWAFSMGTNSNGIEPGGSTRISVTVLDTNNFVMKGAPVILSTTLGWLEATRILTGTNGVAQTYLHANPGDSGTTGIVRGAIENCPNVPGYPSELTFKVF